MLFTEIVSDIQNNFCTQSSGAASGWAGWALAHPEFGSLVNPGADYALQIKVRVF